MGVLAKKRKESDSIRCDETVYCLLAFDLTRLHPHNVTMAMLSWAALIFLT